MGRVAKSIGGLKLNVVVTVPGQAACQIPFLKRHRSKGDNKQADLLITTLPCRLRPFPIAGGLLGLYQAHTD